MAYKIVGEGGGSGGNGADKEREELQELARAIVDAAKQGAWTAAQAVEQPRQENAPPRLPWPVFRSLKQNSFTRGGGSRGGGASRDNGGWSLPDSPEERSSREIQRKMEDEARKRQEYERRQAEEERRRRAASPEPAFQDFTHGGGSRGGGASRGNGGWGLTGLDTPEERRSREIQRKMEDEARKRQEYERKRAEEERRRRAAESEAAFQGFTPGGGSRGGGASRGNDPRGQAEQSPFTRGGISGGGGARRGGSPWEQEGYSPQESRSFSPEQEHREEATPEREEEAEQEEESVSLPPVRQLLAKIAGTAGAGIAGAAGAVNAGIQAAGAAGRIAETFLRPKGVSDWDWSWRESAAQGAKNDLEKSAALYNVGQAKLDAAQRISEELNRKVVFDGTLPVDKTGVIDPETGTIRLNARVGGPENLRDNAVQLLEEQPKTGLDSSGSPGYNAGEEGLFQDAAGACGDRITGKDIIFGSEAKSSRKLASQISKRGWTKDLVMDTVENPYTIRTSINRATGNPATVYYTKRGSYVIVDDVTKAVVQVGDNINPAKWVPDSSIVDPYVLK